MEQLKAMKEQMVGIIQGQLANLSEVNAEELGQAIDFVKDCAEAEYYCAIVKAMKEKDDSKEKHFHYYTPYPMYHHERDIDRDYGRMYYGGQMEKERDYIDRYTNGDEMHWYRGQARDSHGRFMYGGDGTMNYHEHEMPFEMRDTREGRSGLHRRMYMESKEMHKDKAVKIKDLENYMKELSEDIVEMIQGASPEEKQMLEQKMTALTSKIASLPNG